MVQGKLLAEFSVKIALEAAEAGKLFSIENPASSLLWQHPAFKRLRTLPGTFMVRLDMCAYGTKWRKPTTLFTNCPQLRALRALCPRTKDHLHRPLKGRVWDQRSRRMVWQTSLAQTYPSQLCDKSAAG